MTWFKVDDAFWGHPKQTALPAGAVALWVRAGSWSSDQLTDGLVPEHMVTMLGAKKRDAEALVTAGLWDRVDGGYRFHDWNEWQPSRQEVLDKRAEEAERKRKWREKRAADKAAAEAESQGVSQRDKHRTSGGTDAGVPDLSRSSRTRPDPTRPEPVVSYGDDDLPDQTSGGGATEVDGRDPDEPPRCSKHQQLRRREDVPDCWACGHKREQWEATRTADAAFERPPWCGDCDQWTRQVETDRGMARCPSCHPLAGVA